jgi:hypothetical protein
VGYRDSGVLRTAAVPQIEIQNKKHIVVANENWSYLSIIMTIVHTPQLQHKSSATAATTTITTRDQWATERECAPYLVDLARLPESQKDHLRATGFLQKVVSSRRSSSGKKKKHSTTTSDA